jgi:hypothetical protein
MSWDRNEQDARGIAGIKRKAGQGEPIDSRLFAVSSKRPKQVGWGNGMEGMKTTRVLAIARTMALTGCIVVAGQTHCWAAVNKATVVALSDLTLAESAAWLKGQQTESGLIRSYDAPWDNAAYTYDQAVAITALILLGEVDAARKCADGMLAIADPQYGVWEDGYNLGQGPQPLAAGPNSWMGIALLRLYKATQDQRYLSAAHRVADFVRDLQVMKGCAVGSISGGYDAQRKPFGWTSTEHNADAVAFLANLAAVTRDADCRESAIKVAEWLSRGIWDAKLGCYDPGYSDTGNCAVSDFSERLDSQTWTLLALTSAAESCPEIRQYVRNGLPWIDKYLCRMDDPSGQKIGFAKITLGIRATPSIWLEGTAGYVLAARACGHKGTDLSQIVSSLLAFERSGAFPYAEGISFPEIMAQFACADCIVVHFEAHPNCLGGDVGVYGDGEPNWPAIEAVKLTRPYSWYYGPDTPGYDPNNVHTGLQSFRLVNATGMCRSVNQKWASLGLDLGPKTVQKGNYLRPAGVDVSAYKQLVFWAKAPDNPGVKLKIGFRDASAKEFELKAEISPKPSTVSKQWARHIVDLSSIRWPVVDLTKLEHVAFSFGQNIGNARGTIMYLEDVAFVDADKDTSISNGCLMPSVFPQHWPYGSVASTGWCIFVQLNVNPFSLQRSR